MATVWSATASAIAMMDSCGFTSGQLGRIEASATHTPSARRVDRTKLLVGAGGRGARRMEGGQVQASGVGSAQHILQLGQGPHRWGAGDTGQHLHRAGGKEQPANGLQRDP